MQFDAQVVGNTDARGGGAHAEGIGAIVQVHGLGFYTACDDVQRHYIVYVFKINTMSSSSALEHNRTAVEGGTPTPVPAKASWKIYKRFSQLEEFASRLSLKTPFPSKGILPVGLNEKRVRGRYDALRKWIAESFGLLKHACGQRVGGGHHVDVVPFDGRSPPTPTYPTTAGAHAAQVSADGVTAETAAACCEWIRFLHDSRDKPPLWPGSARPPVNLLPTKAAGGTKTSAAAAAAARRHLQRDQGGSSPARRPVLARSSRNQSPASMLSRNDRPSASPMRMTVSASVSSAKSRQSKALVDEHEALDLEQRATAGAGKATVSKPGNDTAPEVHNDPGDAALDPCEGDARAADGQRESEQHNALRAWRAMWQPNTNSAQHDDEDVNTDSQRLDDSHDVSARSISALSALNISLSMCDSSQPSLLGSSAADGEGLRSNVHEAVPGVSGTVAAFVECCRATSLLDAVLSSAGCNAGAHIGALQADSSIDCTDDVVRVTAAANRAISATLAASSAVAAARSKSECATDCPDGSATAENNTDAAVSMLCDAMQDCYRELALAQHAYFATAAEALARVSDACDEAKLPLPPAMPRAKQVIKPRLQASPNNSFDGSISSKRGKKVSSASLEATLSSPRADPAMVATGSGEGDVWGWGRLPLVGGERKAAHMQGEAVCDPYRLHALRQKRIVQIACGGGGGGVVLMLSESGDVYYHNWNLGISADAGGTDESTDASAQKLPSLQHPNMVAALALDKALAQRPIVRVDCGAQFCCALSDAGELYTWGRGEDGQLGHGECRDHMSPRKVMALLGQRVTDVACGGAHVAVVSSAGAVYTWGRGRNGRLGHGDTRKKDTPRLVPHLPPGGCLGVKCGWNFTIAYAHDHLHGWGKNKSGQCGNAERKDELLPVPIKLPGPPLGAGAGPQGAGSISEVFDLNVVSVACGFTHVLVLRSDGMLLSWGDGQYGQLGRDEPGATGHRHAGLAPGPVALPFGDGEGSLADDDEIVALACGAFHSLVLSRAGVLLAWGLNTFGALGVGSIINHALPQRIGSLQLPSNQQQLATSCRRSEDRFSSRPHQPTAHGLTLSDSRLHANGGTIGKPSADFGSSAIIACGEHLSFVVTHPTRPAWARGGTGEVPGIGAGDGSSTDMSMSIGVGVSMGVAVDSEHANVPALSPVAVMETKKQIKAREKAARERTKVWERKILPKWSDMRHQQDVHKMWRQGIPQEVRPQVWPRAIGNALRVSRQMFEMYRERARGQQRQLEARAASIRGRTMEGFDGIGNEYSLKLIDTDLPRTFPSLQLFNEDGPYYNQLRTVLETFACFRPDLGYIQGMSYLAAMLCLYFQTFSAKPDENTYMAFQCLANLMVSHHLFVFYLMDADVVAPYYDIFEEMQVEHAPVLHAHLSGMGVKPSMYIFSWLQTLFLQVLPFDIASRVWDNFMLDGAIYLFRTALAIVDLLGPHLMREEFEVCMPILQKKPRHRELWKRAISEANLFKAIDSVNISVVSAKKLVALVEDPFFYDKEQQQQRQKERTMQQHTSAETLTALFGFRS